MDIPVKHALNFPSSAYQGAHIQNDPNGRGAWLVLHFSSMEAAEFAQKTLGRDDGPPQFAKVVARPEELIEPKFPLPGPPTESHERPRNVPMIEDLKDVAAEHGFPVLPQSPQVDEFLMDEPTEPILATRETTQADILGGEPGKSA